MPSKEREAPTPSSRRQFLRQAGLASIGLTAAGLATRPGTVEAGMAPAPAMTPIAALAAESANPVLRMQAELRRAIQKPVNQRRWIMVIDLHKCVGCMACTIACKAENGLPPGVVYRPVMEEEIGSYPNVTRRFVPRPCMQCAEPPCVDVCPVKATYKRPDGVVAIDYNECIGCRYCMAACPYNARYFDAGDYYTQNTPALQPYEKGPSFEYGKEWRRAGQGSPIGNVRKCQFCLHRLDAGMLPACVNTCIGNATYFGDASDPESLVSQLIATPRVARLREEMGTKPRVYYLG